MTGDTVSETPQPMEVFTAEDTRMKHLCCSSCACHTHTALNAARSWQASVKPQIAHVAFLEKGCVPPPELSCSCTEMIDSNKKEKEEGKKDECRESVSWHKGKLKQRRKEILLEVFLFSNCWQLGLDVYGGESGPKL